METLTPESRAELVGLLHSKAYDGSVAWRAQLVLWRDEEYSVRQIAVMAGTSDVTVRKWLRRYVEGGIDALANRVSTGRPRVITGAQRSRILALSKSSPPPWTGLTHWSTGEMSKYLARHEQIFVSHNFVAVLWRENGLQPWRQGTFKLSNLGLVIWLVPGV